MASPLEEVKMAFPLVEDVFSLICDLVSLADLLALSRVSVRVRRWTLKKARYQEWWSYRVDHPKKYQRTFERACQEGDLEIAQLLYERRNLHRKINLRRENDWLFFQVTLQGQVEIGEWLFALDPTINLLRNGDNAFQVACRAGHLEMAQFIHRVSFNGRMRSHGFSFIVEGVSAMEFLVIGGFLPLIQWFDEHLAWNYSQYLYILTKSWNCKHYPIVAWVLSIEPSLRDHPQFTTEMQLAFPK